MAKGVKLETVYDRGCPEKICPKCDEQKPLVFFARDLSKSDGVTSHCKECRNRYRQLPRPKALHRERSREYMRKLSAEKKYCRFILGKLINAGLEIPDKCEVCSGEEELQAHHPNYRNPFVLVWLCKRCHAYLHRKEIE